ncbi:MAG: hypothetical protein RL701_5791 [Pseudomonadota bacterium]|jgi:3-hydroxymyristoyl/3-hydroxydecanoyl-(acyl carrier protein) dehydratase
MHVRAREAFQRENVVGLQISLQVPVDLPLFAGHFPGDPILPAIAQLDLIVLPEIAQHWPELTSPQELRRLKWTSPIRPGDVLRVELLRHCANAAEVRVEFTILRENEACAQGTVVFTAT